GGIASINLRKWSAGRLWNARMNPPNRRLAARWIGPETGANENAAAASFRRLTERLSPLLAGTGAAGTYAPIKTAPAQVANHVTRPRARIRARARTRRERRGVRPHPFDSPNSDHSAASGLPLRRLAVGPGPRETPSLRV